MTKNKNISIILTIQEWNIFKDICEEFLGTYKLGLSRNRARAINRILDKLESSFKEERGKVDK